MAVLLTVHIGYYKNFLKYFSLLTGGGAAILAVLSLVLLYNYGWRVERINKPYESHKFVITGSTPVLQRLLFRLGRNLNRKKESIIVLITKKECVELQKLGHHFGSEGTLHHSWSRRHKYYLTESRKAMADLEMIRKSRIVEK